MRLNELCLMLIMLSVGGCSTSTRVVRVESDEYPQPWVGVGERAEAVVAIKSIEIGLSGGARVYPTWRASDGREWDIHRTVERVNQRLTELGDRGPLPIKKNAIPAWLFYDGPSHLDLAEEVGGYKSTACIICLEPEIALISQVPCLIESFVNPLGYSDFDKKRVKAERMLLPKGFTYGNNCPFQSEVWVVEESKPIRRVEFINGQPVKLKVAWGFLELVPDGDRIKVRALRSISDPGPIAE